MTFYPQGIERNAAGVDGGDQRLSLLNIGQRQRPGTKAGRAPRAQPEQPVTQFFGCHGYFRLARGCA